MISSMDIPMQFRSRMGNYDIQIDGVDVKATLLSLASLVEENISDLNSHISADLPVVGVDFKPVECSSWKDGLLLLYANGRCLVVQLSQFSTFPYSLGRFLSDCSICFVGLKIDELFNGIRLQASQWAFPYDSGLTGKGAEIRNLAAGVLHDPPLTKCADVFELASKIPSIDMERPDEASLPSDWRASFFSKEEIKYAIQDVFYCHKIGLKLLGMLQ